MEHIRQAVERARAGTAPADAAVLQQAPGFEVARPSPLDGQFKQVTLDDAKLEFNRVIGHDATDHRTKSYDMMRTQVLQSMDLKEWQLMAVTSPTPECGKTLTCINLALSIARQPEKSVLLVDMDFRKPQVANYLGLPNDNGLMAVLERRVTLQQATVQVSARDARLLVLPCEAPASSRAEWMSSQSMGALIQELRREARSRIVIIDLPPILASDDVISLLPQIDCVLFVVAVGTSSLTEIRECNKHLQSTPVVRIVVNKSTEPVNKYYYY